MEEGEDTTLSFFHTIQGPHPLMTEDESKKKSARSTRIKLTPLNKVTYQPDNEDEIPVVNISLTGIGLQKYAREKWPTIGSPLCGTVIVGTQQCPTKININHISNKVIGCQVDDNFSEYQSLIKRFYQSEIAKISVTQIDPKHLKKVDDGEPQWFVGKNNAELFFVINNGTIVRFHVAIFGTFFEGGHARPTRIGYIVDELQNPIGIKPANVVRVVDSFGPDSYFAASNFVQAITSIDASIRTTICSMLQQ